MNFNHQYNYVPHPEYYETNNEPSLTVPDQSYTIKELLMRFTSGGMPAIAKTGTYEEDPTFEDLDPTRLGDFDLADLTELQIEFEQKKAWLDAEIQKQKDAAKTTTEESEVETQ